MTNWVQTLAETDQQLKNSNTRVSGSNKLKHFVEKETHEYITDLKIAFSKIIDEFNCQKTEQDSAIKLYNIEASKNDFMLFRTNIQLNINYSKPGQININMHSIQVYQNKNKAILNININMALGNFEEVIWTYNKKPVNMTSLIKYLVKTFVHASC